MSAFAFSLVLAPAFPASLTTVPCVHPMLHFVSFALFHFMHSPASPTPRVALFPSFPTPLSHLLSGLAKNKLSFVITSEPVFPSTKSMNSGSELCCICAFFPSCFQPEEPETSHVSTLPWSIRKGSTQPVRESTGCAQLQIDPIFASCNQARGLI